MTIESRLVRVGARTAAEIITQQAEAAQPHMGLTTGKNTPDGPIRKADVTVAKNYLTHEEISALKLDKLMGAKLEGIGHGG